jgi:hypothetical protein
MDIISIYIDVQICMFSYILQLICLSTYFFEYKCNIYKNPIYANPAFKLLIIVGASRFESKFCSYVKSEVGFL